MGVFSLGSTPRGVVPGSGFTRKAPDGTEGGDASGRLAAPGPGEGEGGRVAISAVQQQQQQQ